MKNTLAVPATERGVLSPALQRCQEPNKGPPGRAQGSPDC